MGLNVMKRFIITLSRQSSNLAKMENDFIFHVSFYFPVKADKDKSCQPFEKEKKIKERNPEEDADIASSRTQQAGECTDQVLFSVKYCVLYQAELFN